MANATTCNELADYEWLIGPEAAAVLAELPESVEPAPRLLDRLRRTLSPARAHLILELLDLRRRAAAKFAAADRMFFTRTTLQQATDEWVAAYKAKRFTRERTESSPTPILADLCCGIGGDLLALAAVGPDDGLVVGIDRDPLMVLLATANARAVLPTHVAARVELRAQDVSEFALNDVAAWHIDPDRRPGGRRTSSLEWSSPNESVIERLLSVVPDAAMKLAPAARMPAAWEARCELEWISRGGECKQLVAWHGGLARSPGQRRATILPGTNANAPARTIVGSANRSIPITRQADRYIFDVDPAVLAAHLKGALAAEYGLGALSGGATYLSGPTAVNDAALTCFEVTDVLPLRVPKLKRLLRERGVGRLEIKKRGVVIDPDDLRVKFTLRGDNAATLLITPIAGRAAAILAHRATTVEAISDRE